MRILIYHDIPHPDGLYGITVLFPDGDYIVSCNSKSSVQRRRHAFGHELAHIFLGHFNQDEYVVHIKKRDHDYSERELEKYDRNRDNNPCEREANAHAWEYYRRYRKYFLQAEETGKAIIIM